MDYTIRTSESRGYFDHGWLKTYHTFSFGMYYDPKYMGFHGLRVINEDRVMPNKGFGTHSHRNMEIITYVIEGELAHKDSTGTIATLHANELQLMHAGSGITHSEFNPSSDSPVHFLQIWLLPDKDDVEPGYQQIYPTLHENAFTLVASKNGPLKMHQEAKVSIGIVEKGRSLEAAIDPRGYLQVVQGSITFAGNTLKAGDGVAVDGAKTLMLKAEQDSKVLLFNL